MNSQSTLFHPICHCSLSIVNFPGARLYHSTASVWLSVDPLSDKYPSVSPYVYCAGNPVRLVDPDGREIGWIDDGKGSVFWDKSTNSEDEFRQNYKGLSGYSYVSNTDDPSAYTLPNGSGTIRMKEWSEWGISDGMGGPSITLEFVPQTESDLCGWVQTYSSNMPDSDTKSIYTDLPSKDMEERTDFQTINPGLKLYYFNPKGSLVLSDQPGRKLNEGAEYSVNWHAQSSVLFNGTRACSVTWGFTITSENSIDYAAPRIINNPSQFHINTLNGIR